VWDWLIRKMPLCVLVGCLVQSRGVFTIGRNIESRGTFCIMTLKRVTLCGIRELGSIRGGSTCPKAICMWTSAYLKALLVAVAALSTRGYAGLWRGGRSLA